MSEILSLLQKCSGTFEKSVKMCVFLFVKVSFVYLFAHKSEYIGLKPNSLTPAGRFVELQSPSHVHRSESTLFDVFVFYEEVRWRWRLDVYVKYCTSIYIPDIIILKTDEKVGGGGGQEDGGSSSVKRCITTVLF